MKFYDVCSACGKIVTLNKLVFGDLHICTIKEEREKHAQTIKALYRHNKKLLQEQLKAKK